MRQSNQEFLKTEMAAITEAGIPLSQVRGGRRPLYRIETQTDAQAQVVWSYLEAERCLVEHTYHGAARKTWYPTTYLYRLLHDEDRRTIVGIGVTLLILPVLLVVPLSILRAMGIPVPDVWSTGLLLAALAIWVAVEFAVVVWMFNNKEFGMERLLARFALGVAFGVAWIAILGESLTLALLVGGVWTFAGANLTWGVTAGMDHWRLDYEFGRVGGRLPRDVALKRLDELRDVRRESRSPPVERSGLEFD